MTLSSYIMRRHWEVCAEDIEVQLPKDKGSNRYKLMKFIQREMKRRMKYSEELGKLEKRLKL